MTEQLDQLTEQWNNLQDEFNKLDDYAKVYRETAHDLRRKREDYDKELKHVSYKLNQLNTKLKSVKTTAPQDNVVKLQLKERFRSKEEALNDPTYALSLSNGPYLNIILGKVNVQLHDSDSKYKYKCEYENFKLIVNAIISLLTLISLTARYRFIDASLHFLLVWYHCTLTIRESILIVNGSRIKGWWRALQFITTISSGIMIVWPDGMMYDLFRMQYLAYILFTSFLQFLQFYYQQGTLYRLRALGERYDMDITIQGFHSWMWKGLGFLLPFLYLGYAFQAYNAITLHRLAAREECVEWQVRVSAILFFIIFLGNVLTTSRVLQLKLREKITEEIKKNICKYIE